MKNSVILFSLLLCAGGFYLTWKNQQLIADQAKLQAELSAALEELKAERLAHERSRDRLVAVEEEVLRLRSNYLEAERQLRALEATENLADAEHPAGDAELEYELPPLVIPANLRESAALLGSAKIAFYEFGQKYPDGPPAMDSPDYIEYAKEFDILMAELTPVMLGMQGMGDPAEMDASSRAAFFTEMYSSSLGLESSQSESLEQILSAAHQQVIELKLREQDIPDLEESRASWQQRREELSAETWEQMKRHIPTEQQAMFQELYGPDYLYGLQFSIGVGSQDRAE